MIGRAQAVAATSLWILAAITHAVPIDMAAASALHALSEAGASPIISVDPMLQIDTAIVSTLPEYADWPLLHKQLDQTMGQLLEAGVVSLRDSAGEVVVLDSIDETVATVDSLLTAGYSLVIKPEQDPSLSSSMHAFTVSNDISRQIQDHLGVVISDHFYISPPSQRALSPHTDGGDVFVHQWAGSKLWTLCAPKAPDCTNCTFADRALRAELAKSAFEGCTSYTDEQLAGMECRTLDLQENELLYIPRGVVHFARANTTGLSAHATYQVIPPSATWIDLVVDECSRTATTRACNELKEQLLRADLGFRWLNFRFKDVHVAPVLPNQLTASEYTLPSTRLAELIARPASNDDSITRKITLTVAKDAAAAHAIATPAGTCGKGTYHKTVKCVSCESGKYQDSSSHLSTSCKSKTYCSAGTYDANGGSNSANTNCRTCPSSSYQDASNHLSTSCKPKRSSCSIGYYISSDGGTTKNRVCSKCAKGTWMDIKDNTARQCYPKSVVCSPGQEVSNPNDNKADNICVACSRDSYQPSQGLNVQCARKVNTCGVGEYANNADSLVSDYNCSRCPPGTIRPESSHHFSKCYDVTPPELTLVANAILQFEAQTDTFAYPTVTATDTTGETITVTHTNNVHPDTPNSYDVTYSGKDSSGNVGTLVVQITIFAARVPVIVLLGPIVMPHEVHTPFVDPMGYVIDEGEPGNLNDTLISNTSALDIHTFGSYLVMYFMRTPDSQGLSAPPVWRTVNVVDTTPP
ncbi:uncharacterized protein MONBRDRAFT_24455, partial [Monosiga brevicollis MX1]